MVNFRTLSTAIAASTVFSVAVAHPGEVHTAEELELEALARRDASAKWSRALGACSSSAGFQALKARGVERRVAVAKAMREERNINTRKDRPSLTL